MVSLSMNELIVSNLYYSIFLFASSTLLLLAMYFWRWQSDIISFSVWLGVTFLSALCAWIVTQNALALLFGLGIYFTLFILLLKFRQTISVFGIFFFISLIFPSIFSMALLAQFGFDTLSFANSGWPFLLVTLGVMILCITMLINLMIVSTLSLLKFSELYFHFPRRKAFLETAPKTKGPYPFVSIHLPCYAEPPDMVIESLNALANLKYPNFEVIVVDNNTKDPNLWKPLEEHCKKLGDHFRFYHFDTLKGAKAAALNIALSRTDPKAEIIGIVDADYVTEPDFLERFVGAFDNPETAFVQTCHDYWKWKHSKYLSACYYEYLMHFKLMLPGLNERDTAYTVGTMCLIRRKAIEEAGGWAEWCLTEDSELAVRLHALGYVGYYLKDTVGRGLIPETFDGYKNQRFRWVAGPIQQLHKHWRLYLPLYSSGQMTLDQKIGEIMHSSTILFSEGMYLLTIPIMSIALWYSLSNHKPLIIPNPLVLLIIVGMIRNIVANWIRIKLLNGNSSDVFYTAIASRSLIYTTYQAFYRAFLRLPMVWVRTDKFKTKSNFQRAFNSSIPQFFIGLLFIIGAAALAPFANYWPPDLIFLIILGFLNEAFNYLCAPAMAYLAEKELQKSTSQ